MGFLASSSWCARHDIKHLTTHTISVQQPLLVFRLQMKQCQHKHDKLEVSSQSTCAHANKHFISNTINKTQSTAVPTNVSVNCFRVRKALCTSFRIPRDALPGWKLPWRDAPGRGGRRVGSGNSPLAQRAAPAGTFLPPAALQDLVLGLESNPVELSSWSWWILPL